PRGVRGRRGDGGRPAALPPAAAPRGAHARRPAPAAPDASRTRRGGRGRRGRPRVRRRGRRGAGSRLGPGARPPRRGPRARRDGRLGRRGPPARRGGRRREPCARGPLGRGVPPRGGPRPPGARDAALPAAVARHAGCVPPPTGRPRLVEVLDRQEPATRRFLLRTSVTSAVCPALAADLAPGAPAGRLLPGLAAADGFVTTAGEGRTWYRYHPLLREMLVSELRVEDPGGLRDAHRAAARWCAREGESLRSLEHAVAAQDWGLVGTVFVEGAAAQLAGPHRESVAEALRRVQYADLLPDAGLALCAASLAYAEERFGAARRNTALARELLDPVGQPAA